jgi:PAS domain S-box-containing protein
VRKPIVDAKTAIDDIRQGLDDDALMRKYNVSYRGLQSLFKKLVWAGVLHQRELDQRMPPPEESVIIDVAKVRNMGLASRDSVRPKILEKCALAVSDDRSFLQYVEQVLDMNDIRLVKCETGLPDIRFLQDIRADLVIADVGLSLPNPSELIRLMEQTDCCVPMVLVSDPWHEDKAVEGVETGAFAYLKKPVDRRQLMSVVRRAFDFGSLLRFKRDHINAMKEEIHEKTVEVVRVKDFLKGILDSSTLVSVVLADLDQNVMFWNKGAENIFGYTAEEMLGNSLSRLYPPDRLSQDAGGQLRKVVESTSGTAHGKIKQVAKDGRVVTVSTAMSPMRDPSGDILGVLIVGLDVTEEVRQNKEIVELLHEVRNTQDSAIFALAKLTESRGRETGFHLSRIQAYCRVLCNRLAAREKYGEIVDAKFIDDLVRSSVLHDIGMVALPDSVLWSSHRSHPKERELMSEHPVVGGRALEDAVKKLGERSFLSVGKDVAYYHHEWWDGNGYPFGLKGDDIPLSARIVGVADAYDDLTSSLSRERGLSHVEACSVIRDQKGKQFDPELVEAFAEVEVEFDRIRMAVSE